MRTRWHIHTLLILGLGTLAVLAGCSDPHYIIVTVETRPAVHDAESLRVTLSNGSSMVSEDFEVRGKTFPTQFSASAAGRTGDLTIGVEALDDAGLVIGTGSTTATVDSDTATVMVESADFVVNTDFADDQELSNYFAASGFQLGATTDGNWTVVYSSLPCPTGGCNVYGRRFDKTGRALVSQVAASANAFPISTKLTTSFSTPSVASAGAATVTVWNASNPLMIGTYSIECRAFDANGSAIGAQVQIATDEFPNLVAVMPLSNGNFSVAWEGRVTTDQIRAAIVRPDCALLGTVQTISTVQGTLGPERSAVAASADRILYAWIVDGNVRIRIAPNAGTPFIIADTQVIAKIATPVAEEVEHVRVAALANGGFAVISRWALSTGTSGPGRIELTRVNNTGSIAGPPVLITERSGTDFASKEAFGVASRSDGSVLVVWHACENNGDGNDCGVFGRLINPQGMPAGPEFVLATTTIGAQTGPSAVALPDSAFATAWTDNSGSEPDKAGAAVRARIIYPGLAGTGGSL